VSDLASVNTTAAIGLLVALCCGGHLFVIPRLATGAATGVVGGLVSQPGLVVAGDVFFAATVLALTISRRASRFAGATSTAELPRRHRARRANGLWRCS